MTPDERKLKSARDTPTDCPAVRDSYTPDKPVEKPADYDERMSDEASMREYFRKAIKLTNRAHKGATDAEGEI